MKLVLSHISAIGYWRYAAPKASQYHDDRASERTRSAKLEDACGSWSTISSYPNIRHLIHSEKIHVLAGAHGTCRSGPHHVAHTCEHDLPQGSFVSLGHGVFVSSPELCFLHAAEVLGFNRLVAYGHEICGTYALQPEADRGFVTAKRLTSVAKLRAFISRFPDAYARAKALRALAWVADGAASPLETATGMILHLPMKYGGYGLPVHAFNRKVPLSKEARCLAGRMYCKLDLSWGDVKYDLEVQGKYDHSNQLDSDSKRELALKHDGYRYDPITYAQITSPFDMAVIAKRVAREIGAERHWPRMAKYKEKQVKLYDDLFPELAPFEKYFQ